MTTWNHSKPTDPAVSIYHRETNRANQAAIDYIHLGPGRTISQLYELYAAQKNPPTSSYDTLRGWASEFAWAERAACYDALEKQRIEEEYRAERDAVLRAGLSLAHKRVERLSAICDKLSDLALADEALWITSIKAVSLGNKEKERVVQRQFNSSIIRELRALLKDIAFESSARAAEEDRKAEAARHAQQRADLQAVEQQIRIEEAALNESITRTTMLEAISQVRKKNSDPRKYTAAVVAASPPRPDGTTSPPAARDVFAPSQKEPG